MSESLNAGRRSPSFPRLWAAAIIVLVLVTGRLWFPGVALPGSQDQEAPIHYPMVSLLGPAIECPVWIGFVASILLILSLTVIALDLKPVRQAWWLVFGALAVSFVVDQHRLQPWAYQTAIYALIFASRDFRRSRPLLMVVGASIYVYSAMGKFDYQFLHTVGQDFLRVVSEPLGGMPDGWDMAVRAPLAVIFPVTELLIGIGLMVPRSRRLSAVAVMGMHLTLIAVLGPWGLNHSLGVLTWNALLCAQGYALFFVTPEPATTTAQETTEQESTAARAAAMNSNSPSPSSRDWPRRLLVAAVVVAPCLERSGYWDHWLSWSLYSPHTSRLELEVHRTAVDRLGGEASGMVLPDVDGDRWHRVALEQWSLRSRGVPLYPQARYQLGLAVRLAEDHGLNEEIRARWRSVSDRWSGNRAEQRLVGLRELRDRGEFYWLWWSD